MKKHRLLSDASTIFTSPEPTTASDAPQTTINHKDIVDEDHESNIQSIIRTNVPEGIVCFQNESLPESLFIPERSY